MLWNEPHGPAFEGGRKRLFIGHAENVLADDLCLCHIQVGAAVGCGNNRVNELFVGEQTVLGGEFNAIVPGYAFPKMEGDGLAAVRDRPSFGKVADELNILVVFHEPGENLVVDRARSRIVGNNGIQSARVADGTLDEGIGGTLCFLAAGRKKQRQGKNGKIQFGHRHLKEILD